MAPLLPPAEAELVDVRARIEETRDLLASAVSHALTPSASTRLRVGLSRALAGQSV